MASVENEFDLFKVLTEDSLYVQYQSIFVFEKLCDDSFVAFQKEMLSNLLSLDKNSKINYLTRLRNKYSQIEFSNYVPSALVDTILEILGMTKIDIQIFYNNKLHYYIWEENAHGEILFRLDEGQFDIPGIPNIFSELHGTSEKNFSDLLNAIWSLLKKIPAINFLPLNNTTLGKLLNLKYMFYNNYQLLVAKKTVTYLQESLKAEGKNVEKKNSGDIPEKNLSFGFKLKDSKILLSTIKNLCLNIDLLDEQRTTSEELLQVLVSKNLKNETIKIFLGCETVQFAYIVNSVARHFKNLDPATIKRSELFYSKKDTLINAQNLYSNNIEEPKQKGIIDKILKDLN